MPSYVIANIRVHDQARYDEYRKHVLGTVERFGGRFLARGGRAERLEGSYEPDRLVILEFPSYDDAKAWYSSEEYRPLLELRQAASTGDLILADGLT